jgi:serine/threonine-protein kinase
MDQRSALASALADRYRIERELGAGGMATVYLAQDLKHGRAVALKVLKPELAAVIGAERFLSEIRTTATLQHPHVLALFDSGVAEVDGPRSTVDRRPSTVDVLYYVMPYVEGESLRDRLTREKQLPIQDAVRIATEVASALDYAHRHGVIHRDIKPENILLHDGSALVADFGIALAVSSTTGHRMTETGMSLGTPQYMSPEQAMGEREIGPRSDIYALGAVTYEMLTGDPPFSASTAQAIVAKVMTEKPAPPSRMRDRVPEAVEDAVLTALEKLPADRFASAAEFAAALSAPASATYSPGRRGRHPGGHRGATPSRSPLQTLAPWSIAALGVLAAGYLFAARRPGTALVPATYDVATPGLKLSTGYDAGTAFAISSDGSRIVYVANAGDGGSVLMLRDQNDPTPHAIRGSDGGQSPSFSPDGEWVLFLARNHLFKLPVEGGAPVELASVRSVFAPHASWLDNDRIIFNADPVRLGAVAAAGGPVDTIAQMDSLGYAAMPASVPGADVIVATRCTNNCAHTDVLAFDLRNHRRAMLLPNTTRAWPLTGNMIVAVRADGTVIGARWDPGQLRLTSEPVTLLSVVALNLGAIPLMSISNDGALLYVSPSGSASDVVTAVRVDRSGHATVLDPDWHANLQYPALSPDGRQLAVSVGTPGRSDIWVKQLNAGPLTRLTFDGTLNYRAAWLPDGRSLSFSSDRDGLTHVFTVRADGSAKPERVMPQDTTQVDEALWSADGRWLIYRSGVVDATRDIYARATSGDTTRHTIAAGSYDEYAPALSPDGRWLAYVSVESGREQVFVRPFPDAGRARWPVSTGGGYSPAWSHSGRELFYISSLDSMMVVPGPATSASEFVAGPAHALFSTSRLQVDPYHQGFAVTPDDRGFIMLSRDSAAASPANLTIVLHWLDEARRLIAHPGKESRPR